MTEPEAARCTQCRFDYRPSPPRSGRNCFARYGTDLRGLRPRTGLGIASVFGDMLVLNGTTMEEVEKYHLATLKIVIPRVNDLAEQQEQRHQEKTRRKDYKRTRHRAAVREVSSRLRFD